MYKKYLKPCEYNQIKRDYPGMNINECLICLEEFIIEIEDSSSCILTPCFHLLHE